MYAYNPRPPSPPSPPSQQPHPLHPSAGWPLALEIPRITTSEALLPSPASQPPSPRTVRHDFMLPESSWNGSFSSTSPESERQRKGSLFSFPRDDSSSSSHFEGGDGREMTKKERKAQKALEAAAAAASGAGHSPGSKSLTPRMGWLFPKGRRRGPEEQPAAADGDYEVGLRRRAGSLETVSSNTSSSGSRGAGGGSIGGRGGKGPKRGPALVIGDDMFLRSIADSSYLKKPPRAATVAVVQVPAAVKAAAAAPRSSASVKSASTISRRHSCASLSPSVRPGSSASRPAPTGPLPSPFAADGRFHRGAVGEAVEYPVARSSALLLDTFTRLLVTFSTTSKLFTYAKYSTMKMRGSFSHSRSVIDYDATDSSEDSDEGGVFPVDIGGDGGGEEDNLLTREVLEKRAWFLSAMKWLSFERVLFSPGHHLMMMSPGGAILDLDGGGIADWPWHLSLAYPTATIYTLLLPTPSCSSSSTPPPPPTTHPSNLHFLRVPSPHTLSTIPASSIDVITAHYLPRLLLLSASPSALSTHILRECHRILKPAGYLELTLVDPHLSNVGVRARAHVAEHVPFAGSPTKTFNRALKTLGPDGEGLFDEVKTCDMWMPTTSIGDEVSTVTSRVGRCLYDQLYAGHGREAKVVAPGLTEMREGAMWKDAEVIEECAKENTAFRWAKCYARKA